MAKDKFDYCAMDPDLNILCTGSNCENTVEEFQRFSGVLRTLKTPRTTLSIGMESTGIYHMPLYNHLRNEGFHVRILNGLEVRGMKKSRVRKTSNDAIDAHSIARYLMVTETKDSYEFPEELENLREFITAYDILTCKIRTTKNNIIRVIDLLFRGLSNIINLDDNAVEMLEKYRIAEEFLNADQADLLRYMSRRKTDMILRAAQSTPQPGKSKEALLIEMSSLLSILTVLNREKEGIESAMKAELESRNHIIRSIPGIGPITGSIILGKIGSIDRFESAEKLVAFAGFDPVIKESGKRRSERSISKRGDPLLRSAIYLSTLAAIRSNPVISDFYRRKTEIERVPKQKALVAASRKQCHIIWSVWHNNKPFAVPEKFRPIIE